MIWSWFMLKDCSHLAAQLPAWSAEMSMAVPHMATSFRKSVCVRSSKLMPDWPAAAASRVRSSKV